MFEDYDSFSCMLSMLHYVENLNVGLFRSKKELYEHMRSLIELLCKDRESRMYFMSMSGECDVWVGERGGATPSNPCLSVVRGRTTSEVKYENQPTTMADISVATAITQARNTHPTIRHYARNTTNKTKRIATARQILIITSARGL